MPLPESRLDPLLSRFHRVPSVRLLRRRDVGRMYRRELSSGLEAKHLQRARIAVEETLLGEQHDRVVGAFENRPETNFASPNLLLHLLAGGNVFLYRNEVRNCPFRVDDG